MKQEFLKVARDGHFFDHHQKVLVAVSTGRDSMALLNYLLTFQQELSIELGIAHVNHKQRFQSDQEEVFLAELAENQGIPFFKADYVGTEFTEEKARHFRYQFFQELMVSEGYTALVTAHHADDQAETVLMRLIRGSRLRHLVGISSVRPFGPGELIRPLLTFKKDQLEADVFFEDESNHSLKYLRNRARNHYIPLLEEENPRFSKHLLHLASESNILHQALSDLTKNIEIRDCKAFKAQTPAVQYILLQDYLGSFPDLSLNKDQFDQVLNILRTKAHYQSYLKDGYWLVKNYDRFSIEKIVPQTDAVIEELVIESDGIFETAHAIFSLNQEIPHDQVVLLQQSRPILIRKRRAGDRIQVNGLSKKVRRYFIDKKIPLERRQQAIIIEQDENIMAIANIAVSDLSKSLKNDIMNDILYIKMKE